MKNPTDFNKILQEDSIRHILIRAMEKNNITVRSSQIDIMTKVVILFKTKPFDYTAADIGRELKIKYYMYSVYAALDKLMGLGIVRWYRKIGRIDAYQLMSWKPDYQSNNQEYENILKTKEKIRI